MGRRAHPNGTRRDQPHRARPAPPTGLGARTGSAHSTGVSDVLGEHDVEQPGLADQEGDGGVDLSE